MCVCVCVCVCVGGGGVSYFQLLIMNEINAQVNSNKMKWEKKELVLIKKPSRLLERSLWGGCFLTVSFSAITVHHLQFIMSSRREVSIGSSDLQAALNLCAKYMDPRTFPNTNVCKHTLLRQMLLKALSCNEDTA